MQFAEIRWAGKPTGPAVSPDGPDRDRETQSREYRPGGTADVVCSGAMSSLDEEDSLRRRRVADRFLVAHRRGIDRGHPSLPIFRLTEAVQVAHDLFMLGILEQPPTLRWQELEAQTALERWNAQIIPDKHDDPPQECRTER